MASVTYRTAGRSGDSKSLSFRAFAHSLKGTWFELQGGDGDVPFYLLPVFSTSPVLSQPVASSQIPCDFPIVQLGKSAIA